MELIDSGIQGVRKVTEQLRPSLLDDLGLVPALRSLTDAFANRAGLAVSFDTPEEMPSLALDAELALFRAAQEGLANVARHAAARAVAVRLANGNGELSLEVSDDGRGLPAGFDAARDGHMGLAGIRERIGALGGTMRINGARGAGVLLRVSIPVQRPAPGPT
jgi:signal transduction histidine kinase